MEPLPRSPLAPWLERPSDLTKRTTRFVGGVLSIADRIEREGAYAFGLTENEERYE